MRLPARLAASLAALLLARCAPPAVDGPQTSQNFSPAALGMPTVATTLSGSVPLFNRNFWLPPGDWTVVETRTVAAKNVGVVAGFVVLVQHDGAVLRNILQISGNLRPLTNGLPLSPECQSSDVLWNDVRAAQPNGEQDCSNIGFARPVLWRENQKDIMAVVMRDLDQLGVLTPNVVVYASIAESNKQWAAEEQLATNPDVSGITPDMATQRALSAWASFNVAKDPLKPPYVDKLKLEAGRIRADLRRQIDGPPPFVPGSGLTPT